ncbi:methyltransferase domain-containing protein [Meridianimarinicoccus sp. RP-17]|uniref:methyltransferase domain-containing protein n=1 Tax=Meridianimarinicoccus zhengii TaxID=2056810 RepID=UPI000DABCF4C|nr:methyltransferase domain-containing protein [Phycocomes zhengii]
MTTWWHEERLRAVTDTLREGTAARVLDLGCGDGDLFVRLAADPAIAELVGIDICEKSLETLQSRLEITTGAVDVRLGSMTEPDPDLAGFDCALLVETIEHVDPDRLSRLERALFVTLRPGRVVITTPNAEFNALLGVPRGRFRHPDHRFEWDRARFRRWGRRAARAAGYGVTFRDIAGRHPVLGGASQMAVFRRDGAQAGV